tara:strand:- start:87 stop:371 length:285 start_codon:yes stop_codon:yes gene_type:complete
MSLIYFEDMIHYYHTPTLEDIMIEVGDMILYIDSDGILDSDIGWVVHTENHHREDGLANLIYITWLMEGSVDSVWQHCLDIHSEFILVKGGQHG